MKDIEISNEFRAACPQFKGIAIYAEIENTPCDEALWEEIDRFSDDFRNSHTPQSVKDIDTIAATRAAYKLLGKDPSRYRPSAEALCRRLVKGERLYQINTAVDIINLVSAKTGYSIGGFDYDKIAGDRLTLCIGKESDPYTGIGRGLLNISSLPVYKDEKGGIGTPTSDNERTKLDLHTKRILIIINSYETPHHPEEAAGYAAELLKRHVSAKNITIKDF